MNYEKIGFFGAGFSKWCIDLPLLKDLFDFKGDYWSKEKGRIEKLERIYANWKNSDESENNEVFITEMLRNKNDVYSNLLVFYICRRLSEPFIWYEYHAGKERRHTYNIEGSRKKKIKYLNRPDDWLLNLDAILTTNYDLTLEYLLGKKNFNYGYEGEILNGRGDYPVSQYIKPVILSGCIY